ncbi:hypothetical protein SAMN02910409_0660 [Prevotellaceae bacterium HUN156]|nr:hypothetical protein SAMN02910409_0660 [Prevotellaceae bacterium HUN156]
MIILFFTTTQTSLSCSFTKLMYFSKSTKGNVHFLARSEKTNQKRGATPKPPSKGDVNSGLQKPTNLRGFW